MAPVPISTLDTSASLPRNDSIKAVVSLLWPYSSATGHCALLLADPDFRQRYRKGQVRVRFTGASAKAIARSGVGIGDAVELDLKGAAWSKEDVGSTVRTPGRSVDGELIFGHVLQLAVEKGGQDRIVLEVNEASPAASPVREAVEPSTPAPAQARRDPDMSGNAAGIYSSPAFMKRLRLSAGSYVESPGSLLADGDDLDGYAARKRRRVSYKNVVEWRFTEGEEEEEEEEEGDVPESAQQKTATEVTQITESSTEGPELSTPLQPEPVPVAPEELEAVETLLAADRQQVPETESEHPPATEGLQAAMRPPPLPRLQTQPSQEERTIVEDSNPTTPRLEPISASLLPSISPFPTSAIEKTMSRNEYFEAMSNTASATAAQRLGPVIEVQQATEILEIPESPPHDIVAMEPDDGHLPMEIISDASSSAAKDNLESVAVAVAEERPSTSALNVQQSTAEENSVVEPATSTIDSSHDDQDRQDPERPQVQTEVESAEIQHPLNAAIEDKKEQFEVEDEPVLTSDEDSPILGTADEMSDPLRSASDDDDDDDDDEFFEETEQGQAVLDLNTAILQRDSESEQSRSPSESGSYRSQPMLESPRPEHFVPPNDGEGPTAIVGTLADHEASASRAAPFTLSAGDEDEERDEASIQEEEDAWQARDLALDERSRRGDDAPAPQANGLVRMFRDALHGRTGTTTTQVQLTEAAESPNDTDFHAQPGDIGDLTDAAAVDESILVQPTTPEVLEAASAAFDTIQPTPPSQRIVADVADLSPRAASPSLSTGADAPPLTEPLIPKVADASLLGRDGSPSPETSQPPATDSDAREEDDIAHEQSSLIEQTDFADPVGEVLDVAEALSQGSQIINTIQPTPPVARLIESSTMVQSLSQPVEEIDLSQVETDYERRLSQRSWLSQSTPSDQAANAAKSTQARPDLRHESLQVRADSQVIDEEEAEEQDQDLTTHTHRKQSYDGKKERSLGLDGADDEAREDSQIPTADLLHKVATKPAALDLSMFLVDSPSVDPEPQVDEASLPPNVQVVPSLEVPEETTKHAAVEDVHEHTPETPTMRRSSPRKRKPSAKLSLLPDALTAWFTPNRKSVPPPTDQQRIEEETITEKEPSAVVKAITPPLLQRHSQSQGLSTSLSYYTPLTNLDLHINQTGVTVDIIAVATSASTAPARAKAGPRDWYTNLQVNDPALLDAWIGTQSAGDDNNSTASGPLNDIRVEIFRPWKASLPVTAIGDVILLRAFVVKSRKRQAYLLSSEASAWCVWRFAGHTEGHEDDGAGDRARMWTRRRRESVKEEVKGPPVEIGLEERARAQELKTWWESTTRPLYA